VTDRRGQTWQEGDRIFVVVGPPVVTSFYERHPVCFLDADRRVMDEEKHMDEGEIAWEEMPYMTRIS
jgi:hypothetical protein